MTTHQQMLCSVEAVSQHRNLPTLKAVQARLYSSSSWNSWGKMAMDTFGWITTCILSEWLLIIVSLRELHTEVQCVFLYSQACCRSTPRNQQLGFSCSAPPRRTGHHWDRQDTNTVNKHINLTSFLGGGFIIIFWAQKAVFKHSSSVLSMLLLVNAPSPCRALQDRVCPGRNHTCYYWLESAHSSIKTMILCEFENTDVCGNCVGCWWQLQWWDLERCVSSDLWEIWQCGVYCIKLPLSCCCWNVVINIPTSFALFSWGG